MKGSHSRDLPGALPRNLLRNNVPEVLRLALREPVTVVKDGRQIACIVSVAAFAGAGGDVGRLGVEAWSARAREAHEFGRGERHERVPGFGRMLLHAAHSRSFPPVLRNGQGWAVVIPPLATDRTALPSGPWITLDAELTPGTEGPAKG